MFIMLRLCFIILVTVSLTCCSAVNGELALNPQATLLNEVHSVRHNETSRRVIITLTENRRCLQPTFMVRLSGISLYILDQVHHNMSKPVVVFNYPPLVDVGTYFLEVLTMYCDTLNPNDIKSMCLVHPKDGQNVLTLPYKFEVKSPETNPHIRPRWVLHSNATPALLHTRYQSMCGDSYCKSNESEIVQHNQYEWTGFSARENVKKVFHWGLSNLNLTTHTGNESVTICMVGASHAGQMYLHAQQLNLPHYVHFVWVQSRYPQLFDVGLLTNCTYAVIGYGQWQLSAWMQGNPYNAETHEKHTRNILETIKNANLRTQVFMRSMNLNALGYVYVECPGSDFRHPPIVMMYNSIVSKLCGEYNIPYIDMFHLQAPLWDIALDWSHPLGRVFNAEVEHILHYTTTHSITHQLVPVLEPNHYIRPVVNYHYLVRFSDSDVVYLLVKGMFRAVSGSSMYHMGYVPGMRDGEVVVIDAKLKPVELIGPPLPDI